MKVGISDCNEATNRKLKAFRREDVWVVLMVQLRRVPSDYVNGTQKARRRPGKSKWAKFFVSLVKEPAVIARDFDFDKCGFNNFHEKINGTTNRIKNRMSTFQIVAEDKSKQNSLQKKN